jgi:protein O-GlcNAc transferase
LRPAAGEIHSNLGTVLLEQGRLGEAIECARKAVSLWPDSPAIHSNLLFQLLFSPTIDAATLGQEHALWNQRHAQPLARQIRPHANDRTIGRRLRVGYVSPNFREHTGGYLMEDLLAHHDHGSFEITCYSDAPQADGHTQRLKAHADRWRDSRMLDDEQLAGQIRQDGIDILIDLCLHMAGNRMLTFARKPAAVQVTYLGYPGSTGLSAMDYRLTDEHLDPPGGSGSYGPEKLIYLPRSYYCLTAPRGATPVSEPPVLCEGHITFGSFNNLAKVHSGVIAAWSELLQRLPDSRLLVLIKGGPLNERVWRAFENHGVERRRVMLVGKQESAEDYFRLYDRVDVVLDPFPYSGHTVNMDALWMGVPVVTLAGQRAVGRGGVTLLANLALRELIARTPEEYLKIACELAADGPRLAELRRTLRERMRQSPLMDGRRFATDVEAAYREMWRAWCQGKAAGSPGSAAR